MILHTSIHQCLKYCSVCPQCHRAAASCCSWWSRRRGCRSPTARARACRARLTARPLPSSRGSPRTAPPSLMWLDLGNYTSHNPVLRICTHSVITEPYLLRLCFASVHQFVIPSMDMPVSLPVCSVTEVSLMIVEILHRGCVSVANKY